MLLSRRRRVSGGGRRPRKRRASVAATARRSRPSVFGRRGAIGRLSTRGGGARAAAVERDRVRASIRPSSGANPDIPSLREHWLRTKYASRKALSCRSRGTSCRLALRAARAARCAIFTAVAPYKDAAVFFQCFCVRRAAGPRALATRARAETSIHDDERRRPLSIVLQAKRDGFHLEQPNQLAAR